MLGYNTYLERSMNSIKTITDGKLIISNGQINDCDMIKTKVHQCDNMTLTDGVKIVSNSEFLTLDGIDINTTIQQQINYLNNNSSTNINTLQSQINNIIAVNNNQDNSITSLNSSVSNIISVNNSQNNLIIDLSNNKISTINTNLTEPDNASLSAVKSNNTYTLNVGIPRNLKFIGDWSDVSPPFQKGNLVRYNGSVYYCKNDNVNSTSNPASNTNNWTLFVQKGADGQNGSNGSNGSSGLDDLLAALGIITAGVLVPMSLATLLSRINSIPDIQDDVNDIGNDIDNQDNRIAELERKTKYQDSLNNLNQTSFNSDLIIKYTDPITQTTSNKIILDRETGNINCNTIEANDFNANGNIYTPDNLTALGNVNLGTTATSTININSLNTNINGFLTINGLPFTSNLFSQW